MHFESADMALEQLRKFEKTYSAYMHAMGVIELDSATAAPSDSWGGRGETLGVLSELMYNLVADPKNGDLIVYLKAHEAELDPQAKRELEVVEKNYDQLHRIPAEEYVAYNVLLNDAQANWEKAKNADDFGLFLPYLEKIVEYNRKFAGYYNANLAPYDALLNEYEEGLTMEILDGFFAKLRSAIVPLVEKIQACHLEEQAFVCKNYPIARQREFSDRLMEVMGMDRRYCGIAESEHPFTTNFNNRDVRITTHYHEDNLLSSMFSVIHEGGHALYELGADARYNHTMLGGGISMGIHESQSRFYENIIGRSLPFIRHIFPLVQELFPEQTEGVTAEDFHTAVNWVQPSLIRTEADELTYCLHIMVRYEIEKKLIDGSLAVKDVPAEWNRLYKEYLGLDVPSNTMGCLQDIHWSGGSIGYFPSYALGSAYGAQMLHVIEEDLGDIWEDVARGDLSKVTGWLKEHIHQHASFKKPGVLFEEACGKFDASYYTDYLTRKYTKIYDL